jgi:hypothetical protein
MSVFFPRTSSQTPQAVATAAVQPLAGEVFHCYALTAEPDPSVLPRALEFIAKRGLVPYRCHATLEGREGAELVIDMQVGGMDQMTADHVGDCLRQIVGVNAVLMSQVVR